MPASIHWTLAAVLAVAACAPAVPKTDIGADQKAIRSIVTGWNALLESKNDSAIAAIYAPQGALMPPGMPRVAGAAAIRPFWATLWGMNAKLAITTVTVDVAQSGELAVEEGTYSLEVPGGPADNGKYLVVWHKQDGKWFAAQDIWNSDAAPPMPPATTGPTR